MTLTSTNAAITISSAYSTVAAPVWQCLMCASLVFTSHPPKVYGAYALLFLNSAALWRRKP